MLKNCLNCSDEFTTPDNRKKFCGQSCSAKFNNIGIKRGADRFCDGCGNKLDTRAKYCNTECKHLHQVKLWQDGKWDASTSNGVAKVIRNHLLRQADYKCQDARSGCGNWGGFNPKSGKSCLQIEHMDGNPSNHSADNLIVICPNCHSMTETYGALNKGSGRSTRYK